MDFAAKEGVDHAPDGHLPWFDVPGRSSAGTPVVFGHWAALGFMDRPDLLAIDTGCVWGRELTAVRLSDRARRSVDCAQSGRPIES
jgi:bis(5'-nucleosyl)-tetraphosphatase (symmetrical)